MEILQKYEPLISRTSSFYYQLFKHSDAFDLSDLQQAGRIAVWNVFERRRNKIMNIPYVKILENHALQCVENLEHLKNA